jgi:hypothetical protein
LNIRAGDHHFLLLTAIKPIVIHRHRSISTSTSSFRLASRLPRPRLTPASLSPFSLMSLKEPCPFPMSIGPVGQKEGFCALRSDMPALLPIVFFHFSIFLSRIQSVIPHPFSSEHAALVDGVLLGIKKMIIYLRAFGFCATESSFSDGYKVRPCLNRYSSARRRDCWRYEIFLCLGVPLVSSPDVFAPPLRDRVYLRVRKLRALAMVRWVYKISSSRHYSDSILPFHRPTETTCCFDCGRGRTSSLSLLLSLVYL